MDASLGFDVFTRQIDEVLDRTGLDRVALCGVSFGGTIATRYAATYPDRVSALVLVVRARTILDSEPASGTLHRAAVVVGGRLLRDVDRSSGGRDLRSATELAGAARFRLALCRARV